MKAYSLDLRQKIVEACDKKLGSRQHIADTFGVSRSFVQKLLSRRRTRGDIAALPHGGGGKPALNEEAVELIRRLVEEQPDATLEELREAVDNQQGIRVSVSTICTVLKRQGLPRKKSRSTLTSGTLQGYSKRVRSSQK